MEISASSLPAVRATSGLRSIESTSLHDRSLLHAARRHAVAPHATSHRFSTTRHPATSPGISIRFSTATAEHIAPHHYSTSRPDTARPSTTRHHATNPGTALHRTPRRHRTAERSYSPRSTTRRQTASCHDRANHAAPRRQVRTSPVTSRLHATPDDATTLLDCTPNLTTTARPSTSPHAESSQRNEYRPSTARRNRSRLTAADRPSVAPRHDNSPHDETRQHGTSHPVTTLLDDKAPRTTSPRYASRQQGKPRHHKAAPPLDFRSPQSRPLLDDTTSHRLSHHFATPPYTTRLHDTPSHLDARRHDGTRQLTTARLAPRLDGTSKQSPAHPSRSLLDDASPRHAIASLLDSTAPHPLASLIAPRRQIATRPRETERTSTPIRLAPDRFDSRRPCTARQSHYATPRDSTAPHHDGTTIRDESQLDDTPHHPAPRHAHSQLDGTTPHGVPRSHHPCSLLDVRSRRDETQRTASPHATAQRGSTPRQARTKPYATPQLSTAPQALAAQGATGPRSPRHHFASLRHATSLDDTTGPYTTQLDDTSGPVTTSHCTTRRQYAPGHPVAVRVSTAERDHYSTQLDDTAPPHAAHRYAPRQHSTPRLFSALRSASRRRNHDASPRTTPRHYSPPQHVRAPPLATHLDGIPSPVHRTTVQNEYATRRQRASRRSSPRLRTPLDD